MSATTSTFATATAPAIRGFANRRKHLRFSVAAEAELTALRGGWHLAARASELGACGCYLDTPDAFGAGTEVRVRLRYAGESCELPGRVIYVHKGWGMGILFGHAEAAQFAVLDGWLRELDQVERGRMRVS